jgi:hypothetical protein
MGAVIALVIAVGLFGSLAVLVTRSQRATKTDLEVRGKLAVATIRGYDSDGIASFEFRPMGSASALTCNEGTSILFREEHPPGSRIAIRYLPLCPSVYRLAPEADLTALDEASKRSNESDAT